MYQGLFDV